MQSPNDTQYKTWCRLTVISKPSLFSGLFVNQHLPIPVCFPADLMHFISHNLTDLLINLWHGTINCDPHDNHDTWNGAVLKDKNWKVHGRWVADTKLYLPGSFDWPPHNPAEKISSGYKAWEFLIYVFALGPGVFLNVLPDIYWPHFCELVAGIHLIHQWVIRPVQLLDAHKLLIAFVEEFEELYYQWKVRWLHSCWQSVYALLYMALEVIWVGLGVYYTKWTMECTIGILGEEIKQPSNPFANLSQSGSCCSQVNALKAMILDLEPNTGSLPQNSNDIGDIYMSFWGLGIYPLPWLMGGTAIWKSYEEQGFWENWFPHTLSSGHGSNCPMVIYP